MHRFNAEILFLNNYGLRPSPLNSGSEQANLPVSQQATTT